MEIEKQLLRATPLPVIANVARVVTRLVDRITGDRTDYPLLVAAAGAEALSRLGIGARVVYGNAAWIEVLANNEVVWAGCFGDSVTFWIETEFGEVVDLNAGASQRARQGYAPPLLWCAEVPNFYRYRAQGIAELELKRESDKAKCDAVLAEVREKCTPAAVGSYDADESALDFPNEPILCPGRRLLDDTGRSFAFFDRALSVQGMPLPPF